jgi:hypothetical protein
MGFLHTRLAHKARFPSALLASLYCPSSAAEVWHLLAKMTRQESLLRRIYHIQESLHLSTSIQY